MADRFKTTCSYCGVGCGMVVKKDKRGRITIEGDNEHPVNNGMLCSKGMNLHYAVQDTRDRLMYPEMRWSRHHPRQRVSWDIAMKRTSAVFKSIIDKYGADAVGFYISGQCLTEEYYVANKLVKGYLHTNNIDTNSRLCMSSAVTAHTRMFGEDSVPVAYSDIEEADCFLIAGANPAWCHPILFRRIEARKQNNPEAKVIVVDPRKTQTTAIADLHLQVLPGTDIFAYHAIARSLIDDGYADESFIAAHTEGFPYYRASVFSITVEEAAAICDVPATDIRLAARHIGTSKGFLSLWAMGMNQSVIGVDKNLALMSLHLVTGKIGKPGCGPFSLTGQPNAMGGREVGGMATLLPAHRRVANPAHRQEVADFWGVPSLASSPGLTAVEMIEALERRDLKVLWIVCTNPLVSLPDSRRVEAALQKAKFVVVQEISSRSDTLRFADVVLPAAGHLEKEGTMTNSERRITHLSKVIDPPGEARSDSAILCDFARSMGFSGFDFESPEQIFDEHCRLTKGTNMDISGLSYSRLKSQPGFQWPVPTAHHPGTDRLFTSHAFYTRTGKARFFPLSEQKNLSISPTSDLPLILTTGRIRDQWHTMTKTGKVSRLRQHIPRPFLEIHPMDAVARGIGDGDVAMVTNARGTVRVCAKVTDTIRKGVVFLPMHWGRNGDRDDARANNLTAMLLDPSSKQPDFKYAAVQVTRYEKPPEKIVVAGAGAAAHRFLCTYRSLNRKDEIVVISREKHSFYNRVLLPEYTNDTQPWEKLQKFKGDELAELNICVEEENELMAIDREGRFAVDKHGARHFYDKLILATGSRAHVPNDAPQDSLRVLTLRTRQDADRLKRFLVPGAHILIVGGGLLGLELAVALREVDVAVSILQLGSRLMERQLDDVAAELLLDYVDEKNITVYMNDQLLHAKSEETVMNVQLRSGKTIRADAIVYAVGTRPNIEFALEAGIDCARGVIVDDHLQTSDPYIFAIGEIAEHNGKTLGITSAAEKQADVLARFIHGDMQSAYDGAVSMNILKLPGFDLCSLGIPEAPTTEAGYDEILFVDRSMRYYKKCIIKDDRLVGAILVGDKSEFAEFKTLIENQTELSERRLQLLRSGRKVNPPAGKLVCSCNQVGTEDLRRLVLAGHGELKALCEISGAGLGCGSCKPEIQHILRETALKKETVFS